MLDRDPFVRFQIRNRARDPQDPMQAATRQFQPLGRLRQERMRSARRGAVLVKGLRRKPGVGGTLTL